MNGTGLPSNGMREVRVTARKGTPRDFIAPEVSSPSTLALELEKGARGFTDTDAKVVTVVTTPAEEKAKRLAKDVKVMYAGKRVIRHRDQGPARTVSGGPSAAQREARLRAAQLAALEGTLDQW